MRSLGSANSQDNSVQVGELKLIPETRLVIRADREIKLNKTCFQILHILMLASTRIVSKAELELQLWQNDPPESDVLRSNMYTLKNKIDKPFDSVMLFTKHGVGYSIQDHEQ